MHRRSGHFALTLALISGLIALFWIASASPVSAKLTSSARVITLAPSGYDRANTVAYSPDGDLLAVGSTLGISLYDGASLALVRFIPTQTWVRSLAFSPDGSMLASGSYDAIVRLWRVSDGALIGELTGHSGWVRSVSFSASGNLLATASDDNMVRLWNIPEGALALALQEGTDGVRVVAFSPDGESLASGGFDGVVRLWRVSDGQLLQELQGHGGWVRSLAFSPDGSLLASGAFDANVIVWRVEDGSLLHTLDQHSSSVLGLAFSPDGDLLASASVDQTVRLFHLPEGQPYDLLTGHTGFVYSVAFSPDGRNLTSGAADNSVRVWEIPGEATASAIEEVFSPSNCAACHHPRGSTLSARVIETNCGVCHADAALVLNWCPAFLRSGEQTTVHVINDYQGYEPGAPSPGQNLAVVIGSPGNGEHVYSAPDSVTFLAIGGQVFSSDYAFSEIELRLDVWSGSLHTASTTTRPNSNGAFVIPANARPEGSEPLQSLDIGHHCLGCHNETGIALPLNQIHLVVTATAPDGAQAFDERWINVDGSALVGVPVQVLLEDGQPIANVPVYAEARLYEWRQRTFTAISGSEGRVDLQVEALSQVPTVYQISVPPVVVDGIWYEGSETAEITLSPGAQGPQEVILHVREQRGQISGRVLGAQDSLPLWAIHLPSGDADRLWTSAQGEFSFESLPIGQYLLTSDLASLALLDAYMQAQGVDLSQTPMASVELPLLPLEGQQLSGLVTDGAGTPLPFSWISTEAITGESEADTGIYHLYGLPSGNATIRVSAPGYYSQSHVVGISAEGPAAMDFNLVRRPETQVIPWGDGAVILPPETVAEQYGLHVIFEQGWLWGTASLADEELVIESGDIRISIPFGQFALMRQPPHPGWIYVQSGEAYLQREGAADLVKINAGEMAYLFADQESVPIPYDPVIVHAMGAAAGDPIAPTWQPTLGARVRDGLAQLGIDIAQITTFTTYTLAILALLVAPLIAVFLGLKKRRAQTRD